MMRRRQACILLVLVLAGCVTVEGTLRSDGSATFMMTYRPQGDATEFLERRRFSSPDVRVDSVKIYEDQRTVLRATVDDVTRLSTAEGFKSVAVSRTREGDDERLTLRLVNPKPEPTAEDARVFLQLGITLPGPVREASPAATVAGSHVAWTVAMKDYLRRAETVLTVRYHPPPATPAPGARAPTSG